jgi:hypothetical protein
MQVVPQHASPAPPQAWQTFCVELPEPDPEPCVTHWTSGAVHPMVSQQVCPAPPQPLQPPSPHAPPQLAFSHRPPPVTGHADPEGVQTPSTQHPPPLQVLAAQHASPGPPQALQ